MNKGLTEWLLHPSSEVYLWPVTATAYFLPAMGIYPWLVNVLYWEYTRRLAREQLKVRLNANARWITTGAGLHYDAHDSQADSRTGVLRTVSWSLFSIPKTYFEIIIVLFLAILFEVLGLFDSLVYIILGQLPSKGKTHQAKRQDEFFPFIPGGGL